MLNFSLDLDGQTSIVKSKLNGGQCSETLQPPTAKPMQVGEEPTEEPELAKKCIQGSSAGSPLHTPGANHMQVEEEPSIQGSGFEQTLLEEVLPGSIAESAQPAGSNMKSIGAENSKQPVNFNEESPPKVVATNDVAQSIYSTGEVANRESGSPKEVLLRSNLVSSANFVDSAINQSCNNIFEEKCTGFDASEERHFEDVITGGHMQCTQESSLLACTESLGCPTATCGHGKLGNTKQHMSSEFSNLSITERLVETDIFAEAGKCTNDIHIRDSRTSASVDLLSESEIICSYSCCIGCIFTLNRLVKKIVSQEWKLSSSCCTMEDVHDFVSTLSSSLCSTVRNLYGIGGCYNSENGVGLRKLESQGKNACQCESSEKKLANLVECACHSGEHFPKEVDLSSYNQDESILTYMFRDGVLISANFGKEISFHCKYDTLCLSSLIELIVGTKQPLD